MPVRGPGAASVMVEVGGAKLSPQVEAGLDLATVENSLWLPDRLTLVYRDPDGTLLKEAGLSIGTEVKVSVVSDAEQAPEELITGEVTSIEVDHGPAGTRVVVRGLDKSHRLLQGTRTKAYVEVKASDVARQLASKAGLAIGKVDETSHVHHQLGQANVSDWQFLQQLAAENGFDAYVAKGKFYFCKPIEASSAPTAGDLNAKGWNQLVLGSDLVRLRARLRGTEQVTSVEVRGWDPATKQAVVATASPKAGGAKSDSSSATPTALAGKIGAGTFVARGRPYPAQDEATAKATATAEALAGASVELEGESLGNAQLVAGSEFSLGLVGEPFEGRYVASTTRHVVSPDTGYTTWFTVSGRRDPSLLGTASGATTPMAMTFPGVVPATVVDVKDDQHLGRVKVKFPWLADSYSSYWARMVQLGAGDNYGFLILPEVGDEVLVAFDQGHVDHPYIIGNLYNGRDTPGAPSTLVDAGSGKVTQRRMMSRLKHQVVFFDGEQASGITIKTGDDNHSVKLDAQGVSITVESTGKVVIKAQSIAMTAETQITMQAAEIAIKADGKIGVQAGGQLAMQADGEASLQASGITSVKGALVQIN